MALAFFNYSYFLADLQKSLGINPIQCEILESTYDEESDFIFSIQTITVGRVKDYFYCIENPDTHEIFKYLMYSEYDLTDVDDYE